MAGDVHFESSVTKGVAIASTVGVDLELQMLSPVVSDLAVSKSIFSAFVVAASHPTLTFTLTLFTSETSEEGSVGEENEESGEVEEMMKSCDEEMVGLVGDFSLRRGVWSFVVGTALCESLDVGAGREDLGFGRTLDALAAAVVERCFLR